MSDDFFRFNDPVIVLALLVETTLGCLLWLDVVDGAFGFAFTVSVKPLRSEDPDGLVSTLGGTGGGGAADFRDVVLLVAVDVVDVVEEIDERTDVLEGVRFAIAGDNFLLSTGDGGGRLPFVLETREALEGALDRTTLGDGVVAVDRTLVAEAVDITRERAAELGVRSDFAVSKFVEPSLVVDIVELGRDKPDGGRRVEGPAAGLRIVGA